MMMVGEITQEDKYTATILGIRKTNFERNIPFLILSDNLPDVQAYREFNDGHIEIQEVYTEGANIKSWLVRILSDADGKST